MNETNFDILKNEPAQRFLRIHLQYMVLIQFALLRPRGRQVGISKSRIEKNPFYNLFSKEFRDAHTTVGDDRTHREHAVIIKLEFLHETNLKAVLKRWDKTVPESPSFLSQFTRAQEIFYGL
jgi:hypothetical protein